MDNVPNCTKEALCAAIGGSSSRVVIFLDYDGTLAPIVDEPDKAFISEECRAMLRVLATVYPVALVSGRSNDKLKNFVQLEELILAGSHGVHIVGPRGEPIAGPDPEAMVGADALAALDAARTALDAELASIQGYLTEDNVYCISAHYRMVAAEEHERVRAAVHATLARFPSLCHKEGKMVHELRPAIDWNKGKAVEWLLAMMRRRRLGGVEGAADAEVQLLPIYLGDDVADEDAFRAVGAAGGIAIKVADGHVARTATAASWSVPQPEVVGLLDALATLGASPGPAAANVVAS